MDQAPTMSRGYSGTRGVEGAGGKGSCSWVPKHCSARGAGGWGLRTGAGLPCARIFVFCWRDDGPWSCQRGVPCSSRKDVAWHCLAVIVPASPWPARGSPGVSLPATSAVVRFTYVGCHLTWSRENPCPVSKTSGMGGEPSCSSSRGFSAACF